MRLNYVPYTRVLTDSYHSMRCQSVIKLTISGLHPMIILQQNSFVFELKAFWMLHLNDHLYSKPYVFLWVANFRGLTAGFARLPTLPQAFTVGHIYNQKYRGFHPRGYLSLLAIIQHIFSFSCIQPCDPIGRCLTVLSPPNQTPNAMLIITMHLHPCHVMFPCINAMRCAIACYIMPQV